MTLQTWLPSKWTSGRLSPVKAAAPSPTVSPSINFTHPSARHAALDSAILKIKSDATDDVEGELTLAGATSGELESLDGMIEKIMARIGKEESRVARMEEKKTLAVKAYADAKAANDANDAPAEPKESEYAKYLDAPSNPNLKAVPERPATPNREAFQSDAAFRLARDEWQDEVQDWKDAVLEIKEANAASEKAFAVERKTWQEECAAIDAQNAMARKSWEQSRSEWQAKAELTRKDWQSRQAAWTLTEAALKADIAAAEKNWQEQVKECEVEANSAYEDIRQAVKDFAGVVRERIPDGSHFWTLKSWSEAAHDRASDGKFGSSGFSASPDKNPTASFDAKPAAGRLQRAADHTGKILASGVKVPGKALKLARKIGKKAMDGIEKRYGSKVKKVVAAAVLLSLPIPVPGMSAMIAAPILAFAELHRQFMGSKAGDTQAEPDDEQVKAIVREVLAKLFSGQLPSEIDLEAAWQGEETIEPEEKTSHSLRWKTWQENEHPRADDGKFGSGGGAGSPADKKIGKEKTSEQKPRNEKVERAKASAVRVDSSIQRYAEEHNEPAFAKEFKGVSFPDSEPFDVAIPGSSGQVAKLVELKTMVANGNFKLTMDSYAQVRKLVAEKDQGAAFHTVVIDDHAVFNADGEGKHDESKRVYYYRRGVAGSARVEGMHKCKDLKELKKLMDAEESALPMPAQRTDGHLREGKWKFFSDADGKGYKNSKTGKIVRPKK